MISVPIFPRSDLFRDWSGFFLFSSLCYFHPFSYRTLWLELFPELFIRSLRNCPIMAQNSQWRYLCWKSIMRNCLTCSALLLMSQRDYNYLMIPEIKYASNWFPQKEVMHYISAYPLKMFTKIWHCVSVRGVWPLKVWRRSLCTIRTRCIRSWREEQPRGRQPLPSWTLTPGNN